MWCTQLVDLLERPDAGLGARFSLNDFGCQYFQVYKELLSRPHLSIDYFGYDIEKQYMNIGLQIFPELQLSCKVTDVAQGGGIREADVSVISATLEHIDDFRSVIDVLANKSRKMVVIRSFFGGGVSRGFCSEVSCGGTISNSAIRSRRPAVPSLCGMESRGCSRPSYGLDANRKVFRERANCEDSLFCSSAKRFTQSLRIGER